MDKRLLAIYRKAADIAGAIITDNDAPEGYKLSDQIEDAANWVNMGSDGDLSPSDRKELLKLAREARAVEKETENA